MALTIAEKLERQINRQKAAQERARAKQLEKLKDPVEREKRFKKQLASANRMAQKQQEKYSSPEYREQQREKALARAIAAQEKAKAKPPKKKKATRGLKGRTANAEETKVMNAIGQLPCIACYVHGRHSPIVSLHHVFGRTKPNSHKYVLPLCCYHHDTLLPKEEREKYPDMVPVHAKGKYGGKSQFGAANGTEISLLRKVYEMASLPLEYINDI